jgi:uncharacterized protein (TIGR03437 family)
LDVKLLAAFAALLTLAPVCFCQPIVSTFENNYSFISPGLPNYAIAQGSIFDIFGTNLGAGPTPLATPPLPTMLTTVSGVAVVNGVTTLLIFYYVSPTQIAVILPSATPVGTGIVALTVDGKTSVNYPITVAQSAFGILTVNGAGNGPAAAFDVHSNYLSYTNAANPGDIITLWGTGAGPVTGDETEPQTPQNLSNIPIEVDIGGIAAAVQYHGRSIYPGLDQINVSVPANVPTGCYVSVVVRSGSIASNFATIPVAASGRTCSDVITGLSAGTIQSLYGKIVFNTASISLGETVTTTAAGITTADNATATFVAYTPAQFSTLAPGQTASIGSCSVYTFGGNTITPAGLPQGRSLDAGPSIIVTGGQGSQTLTDQSGVYQGAGTKLPVFIPASGGTFTFSNGGGGNDIGAFDAQVTLTAPLTWTNQSSAGAISRAQGVTVQWSGGGPNSFVQISGNSTTTYENQPVGAFFNCVAPLSAGQFTVPATVLGALPPSSNGATLTVANYTYPATFTAIGLDLGLINAYVAHTSAVTYQ